LLLCNDVAVVIAVACYVDYVLLFMMLLVMSLPRLFHAAAAL